MNCPIVTMYDKNMEAVALHAVAKMEAYCDLWKTPLYVFRDTEIDSSRPCSWSKVKLLLELFHSYKEGDWLMWMDADAMIMRHDISHCRFISGRPENFVFCANHDGINCGVFFVRVNAYTKWFLQMVWQMGKQSQFLNHPWWEQIAFHELFRTYPNVPATTQKIYTEREFNAFCREDCPEPWKYRTGDFIAHMAGMTNADRLQMIHGPSLLHEGRR